MSGLGQDATRPAHAGVRTSVCISWDAIDLKTLVIDDHGLLREALHGLIRTLKAARRTEAVIAAAARGVDPHRRVG